MPRDAQAEYAEYLRLIQERNKLKEKIKAKARTREDVEKRCREKGFNLYLSGANRSADFSRRAVTRPSGSKDTRDNQTEEERVRSVPSDEPQLSPPDHRRPTWNKESPIYIRTKAADFAVVEPSSGDVEIAGSPGGSENWEECSKELSAETMFVSGGVPLSSMEASTSSEFANRPFLPTVSVDDRSALGSALEKAHSPPASPEASRREEAGISPTEALLDSMHSPLRRLDAADIQRLRSSLRSSLSAASQVHEEDGTDFASEEDVVESDDAVNESFASLSSNVPSTVDESDLSADITAEIRESSELSVRDGRNIIDSMSNVLEAIAAENARFQAQDDRQHSPDVMMGQMSLRDDDDDVQGATVARLQLAPDVDRDERNEEVAHRTKQFQRPTQLVLPVHSDGDTNSQSEGTPVGELLADRFTRDSDLEVRHKDRTSSSKKDQRRVTEQSEVETDEDDATEAKAKLPISHTPLPVLDFNDNVEHEVDMEDDVRLDGNSPDEGSEDDDEDEGEADAVMDALTSRLQRLSSRKRLLLLKFLDRLDVAQSVTGILPDLASSRPETNSELPAADRRETNTHASRTVQTEHEDTGPSLASSDTASKEHPDRLGSLSSTGAPQAVGIGAGAGTSAAGSTSIDTQHVVSAVNSSSSPPKPLEASSLGETAASEKPSPSQSLAERKPLDASADIARLHSMEDDFPLSRKGSAFSDELPDLVRESDSGMLSSAELGIDQQLPESQHISKVRYGRRAGRMQRPPSAGTLVETMSRRQSLQRTLSQGTYQPLRQRQMVSRAHTALSFSRDDGPVLPAPVPQPGDDTLSMLMSTQTIPLQQPSGGQGTRLRGQWSGPRNEPVKALGELSSSVRDFGITSSVPVMGAVPAMSKPFKLPELPCGQRLKLVLLSTWGDPHYIGLTGIDIYDVHGKRASVSNVNRQVYAQPPDINVLPEFTNDPRTVDKIFDGAVNTCDVEHMWLCPYTEGSKHTVFIELDARAVVSMIRIWNYNKSRPHSTRGVRLMEMWLDDVEVFKGEIRQASGTVANADLNSETILFTVNAEILSRIAANDASRDADGHHGPSVRASWTKARSEACADSRPQTAESDSEDVTPGRSATVSSAKTSCGRPMTGRVQSKTEFGTPTLSLSPGVLSPVASAAVISDSPLLSADLSGGDVDTSHASEALVWGYRPVRTLHVTELKIILLRSWGGPYYIGLTGISLLSPAADGMVEKRLTAAMLKCVPSSLNDPLFCAGGSTAAAKDPRTHDKLVDGYNDTEDDTHMWLTGVPLQFNGSVDLSAGATQPDANVRITIRLPQPTPVCGLRVWNYNQSMDDRDRGAKWALIYADGQRISGGFGKDGSAWYVRKAPGHASFPFGQDLVFGDEKYMTAYTTVWKNAATKSHDEAASVKRKAAASIGRQTWSMQQTVTPLLPCGSMLVFKCLSTHGDFHYIGLDGVELIGSNGENVVKPGTVWSVHGRPYEDVNSLRDDGDAMDSRVLGGLIRTSVVDSEKHSSWLCPYVLGESQEVTVMFDEPIVLAAIRIANYSKHPPRGVEQVQITLDGQLIYEGVLSMSDGSRSSETILFTVDDALATKERGLSRVTSLSSEQKVALYDEGKRVDTVNTTQTATGGVTLTAEAWKKHTVRPGTSASALK